MLITLVFVAIFLVILIDYSFKRKVLSATANIPGPAFTPIIGTTLPFTHLKGNNILELMMMISNYGPISRVWILNEMIVLLNKPEMVEKVLSSPKYTSKVSWYRLLKPGLGNGLLTSNGSKWVARRKIITPAFHFKLLEQFVGDFDKHSSILVKQLESHLDGEMFNVHSYVSLATLDIVCETSMGVNADAQLKSNNEFVLAIFDLTKLFMERILNLWYHVDIIFNIFGSDMKRRTTDARKVLKQFRNRVINERRELIVADPTPYGDNCADDTGSKKKFALLDVLLQATIDGMPLSNADISEEVSTFLSAGQDTSASAISFTLFLLSRHPEIQSRVYQEICEVIGTDKNKEITYNDLQNLKYLDCVIKESLRLHPVIPAIGRLITEDIDVGEYTLPAGTNVVIPIFAIMRDPELFPEPEKFIPERHFAENISRAMYSYSFIPFSAGPRNCVGQKFAMLEMKSIVSKVLRHYELLPLGSDPILVINVVLQSSNGINVGIKAR